jgi:hypothetical protein
MVNPSDASDRKSVQQSVQTYDSLERYETEWKRCSARLPACTMSSCVTQESPPCEVGARCITPAINEGRTRSLRISHTSRRAPLQPVSKTQVPCTPYHPPNIAGVATSDRYAVSYKSYREGCVCLATRPCKMHTVCVSVGSVYAREKRKSDQPGLVRHTKHMDDYCRGLTAQSTLYIIYVRTRRLAEMHGRKKCTVWSNTALQSCTIL